MNDERFRLIVHIGSPKAGSSAIQKYCEMNKESLRCNGVSYLGLMLEEAVTKKYPWQKAGGFPSIANLGDGTASEQLIHVLECEINQLKESGSFTAIWSNESIFANYNLFGGVFKKLASKLNCDIDIVVFVRQHYSYIASAYLQWGIKHKNHDGEVLPFSKWIKKFSAFYLAPTLNTWSAQPHWKFHLKNYDACGDVVSSFLNVACLDVTNATNSERINVTPSRVGGALWALYNSQFAREVLPGEFDCGSAKEVLRRDIHHVDIDSLWPRENDFADIDAKIEQDACGVNKLLSINNQPPLELGKNFNPDDEEVTQNQINAALLLMIKTQDDQIADLKKVVNSLNRRLKSGES